MARLLMEALRLAGHEPELASRYRVHLKEPEAPMLEAALQEAQVEAARLIGEWRSGAQPDLWFCYHPYYKSPDLLGPALCERTGMPYVTAEASLSERRSTGAWSRSQALVADAVQQASVNLCFTARDNAGLRTAVPSARTVRIAPFIDVGRYQATPTHDDPTRLVSVAMMRPGDKFASYRMLAEALASIADQPWTLTIVGGGPMRREVEQLFAALPASRIAWLGEVDPSQVPEILRLGGIYVWPGTGEAYGLSYLEAQASGLPVVAQHTAGVPEVVCHGRTGLLTPAGDVAAFADAIKRLIGSPLERTAMSVAARRFVLGERTLAHAAMALNDALRHAKNN